MPNGVENFIAGAQVLRQGEDAKDIVARKLRGRVFLLDNPQKAFDAKAAQRSKRKAEEAEMRAKRRRYSSKPKVDSIVPPRSLWFGASGKKTSSREGAKVLNGMWKKYVDGLLGETLLAGKGKHQKKMGTLKELAVSSRVQSRAFLRNVDLHGCRVQFTSCHLSSGTKQFAYVVGETKNALLVIFDQTKSGKGKEDDDAKEILVPKKNSAFEFLAAGLRFSMSEGDLLARRIVMSRMGAKVR